MQEGHVYRKANGTWMLQYWKPIITDGKPGKKRVAKKLGAAGEFRTENDEKLVAEVRKILAPINAKTEPAAPTDTLAAFIEGKYLPDCEANLKPSTYRSYAQLYSLLKPHLGDLRLDNFTPMDATRIMRAVAAEKQRAHTTFRNLKRFLCQVFTFAMQNNLLTFNPARVVKIPRGNPAKPHKPYTIDEVTGMLAVLGEPARTIVLTAALTGLRKSELAALRWEDLTEEADRIMVRRSVWNGRITATKTLASENGLPLVPMLRKALEEHKSRTPDGFIFQSRSGKPARIDNICRLTMRPALTKAGIVWRGWHQFRHGVGTNLRALGVDIKLVSDILRHSDTAITLDLYTNPGAKETAAALTKLDKALGRSMRRAKRA